MSDAFVYDWRFFVIKYLFLGVSLVAIGAPAMAQDEAAITVTATGTRIEVEDTGQAVTVIGLDEIEAMQLSLIHI